MPRGKNVTAEQIIGKLREAEAGLKDSPVNGTSSTVFRLMSDL